MQAVIHEVLAALRQAEATAAEARPGSDEYHDALAATGRLHAIYQDMRWDGVTEASEEDARRALAELHLPETRESPALSGPEGRAPLR